MHSNLHTPLLWQGHTKQYFELIPHQKLTLYEYTLSKFNLYVFSPKGGWFWPRFKKSNGEKYTRLPRKLESGWTIWSSNNLNHKISPFIVMDCCTHCSCPPPLESTHDRPMDSCNMYQVTYRLSQSHLPRVLVPRLPGRQFKHTWHKGKPSNRQQRKHLSLLCSEPHGTTNRRRVILSAESTFITPLELLTSDIATVE